MFFTWISNRPSKEVVTPQEKISVTLDGKSITSVDVTILPYLLTDATQITSFEAIAHEVGCPFSEIYLSGDRNTAISKLLKRGRWGEAGSPLLTENDMGEIGELYEVMSREMSKRSHVVELEVMPDGIDGTYKKLLEVLTA